MKKLLLLFIMSLFSHQYVFGQSKISPSGMMIIEKAQQEKRLNNLNAETEIFPTYVTLNDGYTSDCLLSENFDIISDLGNIVIVALPVSEMTNLAALKEVKYVDFGGKQDLSMNYARPSGAVNDVQDGFEFLGQNHNYDGTGVVLGMMDTGLQASHLNFKDENGSSRIQRIWWYEKNDGVPSIFSGLKLLKFTTDSKETSHATHVAGIMGGSYKGKGRYCYVSSPTGNTSTVLENSPIPYYGIAPGSSLALAVGSLYDANITSAVTNIVNYSSETNKPCVINLSIGSTIGPHDGTDSYTETLNILGKKAIICISAGNDGDLPISITKKFSNDETILKTMLVDNKANGIVDIWVNNNQPVNVKWAIYDIGSQKVSDIIVSKGQTPAQTVSASDNEALKGYFTGTLSLSSGINVKNNRYNIYTSLSLNPVNNQTSKLLALIIEGNPDQEINIYGQSGQNTSTLFTSNSIPGWDNGSSQNSINDAACAENVIAVGAYTSRRSFGLFQNRSAYSYTGSSPVNSIAPFSSYGKAFSGRSLPDVSAPGSAIISSYNRYYVTSGQISTGETTASATNSSELDYWGPMQGTSMSCPFVSGVIALWLQANPNLTHSDVMDIINNTSVSDITQEPQRWGAGKINALEGIRYILQKYAANGAVWEDDDQRLVVSFNGSGYDVTMAGEAQFTVTVYDIQGRPVATARGLDGQASVTTSELTPGVYVLAAQGASSRLTRKVTVR